MKRARAFRAIVSVVLLAFSPACTKATDGTSATAAPSTAHIAAATAVPNAGNLAGAIYRGTPTGNGADAHVDAALAAAGYDVYVRPRGGTDWIGPVITDTYGRFVFTSLAPGKYLARAYTGPVRVWEQIVDVPSVLPPIVARDVTVLYFSKSADNGRVEAALESLGFPYEQRAPLNQEPTNAVFFGRGVQHDDVTQLATALVRSGVRLQSVRGFADSSGPKAKLIEIEADKQRKNDPLLTVEGINAR